MEQTIEKIRDSKAQLAGAIVVELSNTSSVSKIDVLEAQADLYDAMIEMCEAINRLFKK